MHRLGELHLDEDVVKMASGRENKSGKVNESATPRNTSAAPGHHHRSVRLSSEVRADQKSRRRGFSSRTGDVWIHLHLVCLQ
jgi:hypothetical protein